MTRQIKIAIIDDDTDYASTLVEEALEFGFRLLIFNNLDEGIVALESDRGIKAVILDSRCPIYEDQNPGTAKSSFIFQAIQRLVDIEHLHNRYVPYCLNTETPDEFKEDLEGIAPVFKKTHDHERMFLFLQGEVDLLPETALIKRHDDVFEFFDRFLSPEDEELLLALLTGRHDEDFASVVTGLNRIRRLEESLFDVIAAYFLKIDPMQIPSFNMSRTKNIILRLRKSMQMPLHLYDFAMDIYTLTSKYGAHKDTSPDLYRPGRYTVNSLIYSFFELCEWARSLPGMEVDHRQ